MWMPTVFVCVLNCMFYWVYMELGFMGILSQGCQENAATTAF